MKFLVFIPARGGSVGVKNKNLIEINNKPLIKYTLDVAKKTKNYQNHTDDAAFFAKSAENFKKNSNGQNKPKTAKTACERAVRRRGCLQRLMGQLPVEQGRWQHRS